MSKHVLPANIDPTPTTRMTRAAEGLPRWRWTVAELEQMVELGVLDADERIELIGGEIVPMSSKGRLHEVLKEDLAQFWTLRAPGSVRVSVEQQFNLDPFTYTDPDIIVRPATVKTYDLRGGTVLLVVEVADSSFEKDIGHKAQVYASFSVREYWVIDARTKSTRVHRGPTGGAYAEIRDVAASETLTPLLVPQLGVRLADLDLA